MNATAQQTNRISVDVEEFLGKNRYSRSLRNQKPASSVEVTLTTSSSKFLNMQRREIHTTLQRNRTDELLGNHYRYLQNTRSKSAAVSRAESLTAHVVGLVQKLIAEIARNPGAFVHLSQSETAAMNSSKVSSADTSRDPKAALRLAAIKAMQAPVPVTLQSAITKIEDAQKKLELSGVDSKNVLLFSHLAEFGYTKDDAQKIVTSLPEASPIRSYIQNGTIPDKRSLDSVLSAFQVKTASKHLK